MTNRYRELAERIIIKFDLSLDDLDDLIEVIRSWGDATPEPESPPPGPDLAAIRAAHMNLAQICYLLDQGLFESGEKQVH